MKHLKKGRKLGRERGQRTALLKSLSVGLIEHGRIRTTLPKAKEMRSTVERLVTYAKTSKSTQEAYRKVGGQLPKAAAKKLITQIAPRYKDRTGGYTRVIRLVPRKFDAARMAYIEFV